MALARRAKVFVTFSDLFLVTRSNCPSAWHDPAPDAYVWRPHLAPKAFRLLPSTSRWWVGSSKSSESGRSASSSSKRRR